MKGSVSIPETLTSNRDIATGLILSGFAELFNSASVFARVVRLGFADGEAALALVVGDEETDVRGFDLHAVLVPFHPSIGVVDLALQLQLLLRDAVLALLQLLGETELRISG